MIPKEDYKFLIPLLMIFIVSGFNFFYQFNEDFNEAEDYVATVTKHHSSVKRKNEGTYNWQMVKTDSHLFQNDLIFTGEDSAATIEFIDGLVIELKSSTLIKILEYASEVNVDLVEGEMTASFQKPSTARIHAKGQEFRLKNRGEKGSIALKFNGDKPIVHTINGDIQIEGQLDLKKAEPAKFINPTEAKSNEIIFIKPKMDDSIMLLGQEQKVLIQWEEKNITIYGKQNLLIASDENFKNILYKIAILKNEILIDLPPGKYFCKIVSGNNTNEASSVLSFSVKKSAIEEHQEKKLDINDLSGLKKLLREKK